MEGPPVTNEVLLTGKTTGGVYRKESFDYAGVWLDGRFKMDIDIFAMSGEEFKLKNFGKDATIVKKPSKELISLTIEPKMGDVTFRCNFTAQMKVRMEKLMGSDMVSLTNPEYIYALKHNLKIQRERNYNSRNLVRSEEENRRAYLQMLLGFMEPDADRAQEIMSHPIYQLYGEVRKMNLFTKGYYLKHVGTDVIKQNTPEENSRLNLALAHKRFLFLLEKEKILQEKQKVARARYIRLRVLRQEARDREKKKSLTIDDFKAPLVQTLEEQQDLMHIYHLADHINATLNQDPTVKKRKPVVEVPPPPKKGKKDGKGKKKKSTKSKKKLNESVSQESTVSTISTVSTE